jgi:hypothetical protein
MAIRSCGAVIVVASARRAEHAERGIWAAKQSDADHDQGADQQDAGAGPDQEHQPASVARRVSENRIGFMPPGAPERRHSLPMGHEASVGEWPRRHAKTARIST